VACQWPTSTAKRTNSNAAQAARSSRLQPAVIARLGSQTAAEAIHPKKIVACLPGWRLSGILYLLIMTVLFPVFCSHLNDEATEAKSTRKKQKMAWSTSPECEIFMDSLNYAIQFWR
jgi:hypothetical protein